MKKETARMQSLSREGGATGVIPYPKAPFKRKKGSYFYHYITMHEHVLSFSIKSFIGVIIFLSIFLLILSHVSSKE